MLALQYRKQLDTITQPFPGFFDEKAMPSAGLVNFAQSFVCTFNNTCHREAPTDVSQVSTYNDTL